MAQLTNQLTAPRPVQTKTPEANAEPRLPFGAPMLAVLCSSAFLYITFAVFWAKFSRAEVFFAECAREMVAQHNWITPLYQGKPFFDKPILVYWLIVSMFKIFGVSHWAARIPSIVASLATVTLTGFTVRRAAATQKEKAGIVAAMCLSASFMFFSFSSLCMSDMLLVLCDSATMLLVYLGIMNSKRRSALWFGAAASMGVAFITKGPVGVVLPGLAAVIFLVLTRRLHLIKWYHAVVGAIIIGLIAVPWFFAAYQANGTWALAYFFIRENFQRYAGATYDTHKPFWFMTAALFTGFLPWSIFLPPALFDFVHRIRFERTALQTERKLYLWIWLAVVVGFFSMSRGKCDYYILPIYPAAAALVGLYLTEAQRQFPKVAALILSAVFLGGGLLSPALLSSLASHQGAPTWWLMPATLIVFGVLGLIAASAGEVVASLASLFFAITLTGGGLFCQLLPSISELQEIQTYTAAMRATAPTTHIGVHKALGHWVDELTFTVERNPVDLDDTASIEQFFLHGKGIALIPENNYQSALEKSPALRDAHLRILDRRLASTHPLTPGYIFQRKGSLYDTTLLLVAN